MRIQLLRQASLACGISLMAAVTVLSGGTAMLAAEQSEGRDALPKALNELMVGCNQGGAINYLLENDLGRRLELVYGGLGRPPKEPAKKYDEAYVLRLGGKSPGSWSPDKVCLYFREGYLVYKCVVPDEEVDLDEVFRREIESGLQHPSHYPSLRDKIHWGEATQPQVDRFLEKNVADSKDPATRVQANTADLPKVRCGIALEALPPSVAKEQGYNVLVFFQNAGPVALDDNMLLLGFPIGPVILVTTSYRDRDEEMGHPGHFGIYGTRVFRLLGNQVTAVRGAAFHLDPGEITYMWFHVSDLQSYDSIQAKVTGLWGAQKEGEAVTIRIWDAESPKVSIPRKESQ